MSLVSRAVESFVLQGHTKRNPWRQFFTFGLKDALIGRRNSGGRRAAPAGVPDQARGGRRGAYGGDRDEGRAGRHRERGEPLLEPHRPVEVEPSLGDGRLRAAVGWGGSAARPGTEPTALGAP